MTDVPDPQPPAPPTCVCSSSDLGCGAWNCRHNKPDQETGEASPQPPAPGRTLNDYAAQSHADNAQWWHREDGTRLNRNKGELLMLIVSEISEAMEGERKGLMDDKLPHRLMAEVELADALIRVFDYAGAFGYDLEAAYQEKRAYNASRLDHKHEARAQAGGKKW